MALTDVLILMLFALSAQLWSITDSVRRCKQYPDPKHGRMVCDSLFRLFCAAECDEGFVFEFKPAVVYMCGPLTGEWFTYPEGEKIPWPDCVKRKSAGNSEEDDIAARRAHIAAKIHQTHKGIFINNYQMQPVQTGQPNARYLHLFDYIQRAQQIYNDKKTASTLGYHELQLEQQKQRQQQLQLQQQQQQQQQQRQKQLARQLKQKQREMQQQLQSRTQMQKLRLQQEQSFQQKMVDKQRQQREAFELSNTNDYNHQDLNAPRLAPWRYALNQNFQDKLRSDVRVTSKPASPGGGATSNTFYPNTSQELYKRYPMYGEIPTNNKGNTVTTGEEQPINPVRKAYSVNSQEQNGLPTTLGYANQLLEKSRVTVVENMPLSLSQTVIGPTWRRSGFNIALPKSHQYFTNLTLQPVKNNHRNVSSQFAKSSGVKVKPSSQSQDSMIQLRTENPLIAPLNSLGDNRLLSNSNQNVNDFTLKPLKDKNKNVYSRLANEITSSGVNVQPVSQSQDEIQLHSGNPSHAPPNKVATQLSWQKTESQVNQFSLKPTVYTLQTKNEGAASIPPKDTLNITTQTGTRGDVANEASSQPQEKTAKKEKLFYFPIKKDTLLSLLPMQLQEKYRSLRDTRNVNSSYKASIGKNKANSTVKMEGTKLQNIYQKVDLPTSMSSFKYSVQQIKTGNDSITEYFYLRPSQTTAKIINSTNVNSSVNQDNLRKTSIREPTDRTIVP